MKKIYFILPLLIIFPLFAETSFIINKSDVEKKHNKQFLYEINITNYTYTKKLSYQVFASNDCITWEKVNNTSIIEQDNTTYVKILPALKKSMKEQKIKLSDYNYFKFSFKEINSVDYVCNIGYGNLNIYIRSDGDINAEIPPVKTKNTFIINKASLEKKVDIFPDDEIKLRNKDDDHIKRSVEFKVYCNKKDKWVYLGYLDADEDSSDDFEFDDNLIDFVNATYIALVPVKYQSSGSSTNGFFIGNSYFSYTNNYSYTYVTPDGVMDVSISSDDLILNFRAETDEDGSMLVDEI